MNSHSEYFYVTSSEAKYHLTKEEIIKIEKLVHGGQGLGEAENGKKIFAWGALPGETVKVKVVKNKKDWAEGFVV